MIDNLKNTFSSLKEKECIEIVTEEVFEILDHEEDKRCYIIESNGQFRVINSNQKEIGFLAIDSCLFNSSDGSRADCIIFDNEFFCFIELKHCKKKNIPRNRQKAKKQLIAIIELFQEKIKIKRKLEAYICVTCLSQDGTITMVSRADNLEAQLEFDRRI